MSVRLEVVADGEAASRFVADRLAEAARTGGHVVLTGGETPRRAYEIAAELQPDWSKTEIWWGDERCVPPDNPWSNYLLAKDGLLDRLKIGPAAVHRIRGEDDPEEAAAAYEAEMRGVTFDLILNGLGPDGHTASLFPNAPTLEIRDRLVVPADPALDPFVERITMTIPALGNCRTMLYLTTGDSKADAVHHAFGEPPSPSTPASLVRSSLGDTLVVLDCEAAAQLPPS